VWQVQVMPSTQAISIKLSVEQQKTTLTNTRQFNKNQKNNLADNRQLMVFEEVTSYLIGV